MVPRGYFDCKHINYPVISNSASYEHPDMPGTNQKEGIVKKNKIAVIGAGPLMRGITRVVLALIGKIKYARFFPTEEEAMVWIREK